MDPRDEENDDLIVLQFSQFIDMYLIKCGPEQNGNLLNPVKYLKGVQLKHNLYTKLVDLEMLKKKQQFRTVNSTLKPTESLKEMSIYTIGPKVLAEQLTVLQFEYFKNMRTFEFIGFPWRKCANKCPGIVLNNKHFENIARWVGTEIVVPKTVTERAQAMKFFIDLCINNISEFKNFETVFAISAGLMSAAVFRLKLTRQEAGEEYEEKLERLREIVSLRSNFRYLRGLLESVKDETSIPYLGLFLSDLKGLHDTSNQFRKYLDKEKELQEAGVTCINWFIVQREYQIIHQLMYWKQLCEDKFYDEFEKDVVVQNKIDDMIKQAKSVEELYQLSLKREPRQTN